MARRLAINAQPLRSMTVDQLLAVAETIALQRHDGHLSIFRFTTNWKVVFGTPPHLFESVNEVLSRVTAKPTLKTSLVHAIKVELDAGR